jgi:hypothetical protein
VATLGAAINALTAMGVAKGATHPESARLICDTIDGEGGPNTYAITADYLIPDTGQFDPDPLKAKTRWRWQPASDSLLIDRDFYNNPIGNSAGVPFDQPSQSFEGSLGLVAIRNEPFYDVAKAMTVMNTTNSKPFTVSNGQGPLGGGGGVAGTVGIGQAFCVLVDSQTDIYNGVPYATVSYNFRFKRGRKIDGLVNGLEEYDSFWDVKLDQGDSGWFYNSHTSKATRGLICNERGLLVGTVKLNGNGQPLDPTLKILASVDPTAPLATPLPGPALPSNVYLIKTTDAVYIARRKFGQYDHTTLGL